MENKIKITLPFATLIPDFIYQFLSSQGVKRDAIDCMGLEDVRDALIHSKEPELAELRKFLQIDDEFEEDNYEQNERRINSPADDMEHMENFMDEVDSSLELIDEDMYHRYTPGELRYVFEMIVYNIDLVYDYYKKYSGLNLALSVGFVIEEMGISLESNMIVEFLHLNEEPEPMDAGVYILPMKKYNVSDDIIARVYIYIDESKKDVYEKAFTRIAAALNYTGDEGGGSDEGQSLN